MRRSFCEAAPVPQRRVGRRGRVLDPEVNGIRRRARQGGTDAVPEGRSIQRCPFKAVAAGFSLQGGGTRFGEGIIDTTSRPSLHEPPCAQSSASCSELSWPPRRRVLAHRVRARVASDLMFLPACRVSYGATPTLFHHSSLTRGRAFPPLAPASFTTSTAHQSHLLTAPAVRCVFNLQGRHFVAFRNAWKCFP
jgi:hypothetical protein